MSPGLKFLVRLCTDLGLNDAQEYATKLKKAEKNKELREQVSFSFYHPISHFLHISVSVYVYLSFVGVESCSFSICS